MKRTEVDIFYNNKKGLVFASKTKFIGRVTYTTVNPVILLKKENITDEVVGQYARKALDISRNAQQVDKDLVGIYEYWVELGMKKFSTFSKNYTFIDIEEIDNKLYFRKWSHVNRGGYIAECKSDERKSVDSSISDKELGELVKKELIL